MDMNDLLNSELRHDSLEVFGQAWRWTLNLIWLSWKVCVIDSGKSRPWCRILWSRAIRIEFTEQIKGLHKAESNGRRLSGRSTTGSSCLSEREWSRQRHLQSQSLFPRKVTDRKAGGGTCAFEHDDRNRGQGEKDMNNSEHRVRQ